MALNIFVHVPNHLSGCAELLILKALSERLKATARN
jgi:hypothetical protein